MHDDDNGNEPTVHKVSHELVSQTFFRCPTSILRPFQCYMNSTGLNN